ncbi:MAG: hypothetical protein FJ035_09080, partial [Chloroflexi bacterium]|nr:hypothetical protein [Chloroflexota bacterium]
MFFIVFTLTPFVAAGALVALLAANSRELAAPGDGVRVRRLFVYILAFVAYLFATVGVALLLGGALEAATGGAAIAGRDTELAAALASTVVGLPTWLLLTVAAQRGGRARAPDRRSIARRLYLDGARVVALTGIAINAVEALGALVARGDAEPGNWGWLVAWSLGWALHERAVAAEPPPTAATRLLDRIAQFWGAFIGLYALVVGAIVAATALLLAAYDGAWRELLVAGPWAADARRALVGALVGALIWWWYWLRARDERTAPTTLTHVHLFIGGVLPGVALVAIPAARAVYAVLQWLIGEPGDERAVDHFALLPGVVAMLLVGAWTWTYHRAVLRGAPAAAAATTRSEPERIYRYVVSAAGLLALAGGLLAAFALAIDLAAQGSPELARRGGWWRNHLSFALTALLVGVPLWARYWTDVQRATARAPAERAAPSRRIYLFAIFGAAVLGTLINLTVILYRLFEALLDTATVQRAIFDSRWSIALVITAGAIALYHWLVLREDQPETRAPAAPAPATPAAPAL